MAVEGSTQKHNRRLRLGMVGGGPGAFIGAVHRMAARLDEGDQLALLALMNKARGGPGRKRVPECPAGHRNVSQAGRGTFQTEARAG